MFDVLTRRLLGVKRSIGTSKLIKGDKARLTSRLVEGLADFLDRDPRGRTGVPTHVVSEAERATIDFDRVILACATVHQDAGEGEHLCAGHLRH